MKPGSAEDIGSIIQADLDRQNRISNGCPTKEDLEWLSSPETELAVQRLTELLEEMNSLDKSIRKRGGGVTEWRRKEFRFTG